MLRRLIVLFAAGSLSGCSLLFVNGPPPGDGPLAPGYCTTSRAAPTLDAVAAGLYFGAALAGEVPEGLDVSDGTARAIWFLYGAGLTGSSLNGARKTKECRARIGRHLELEAARLAPPDTLRR